MKISKLLIVGAVAAMCVSGVAEAKSYKRGVSENQFKYHTQMEAVGPGVTWFYNWANTLGAYIADQEYLEFVPMCWNGNFSPDNIRAYVAAHPDCKYLLGFNEPNFKAQANMSPAVAAERWPEVQAMAKELNLKLVAPALNYSPDAPYYQPTAWMDEFVDVVGKDAFDFVAIHFYGGFGGLKDLATTFHERYGKPVWVTEFCYWPGEMGDVAVSAQMSSMIETVEWLEKTDWIYRYAWFKATENSRANFKLIESGTGEDPRELTELGKIYVYMSDFNPEVYHPVETYIPATDFIGREFASLGATNFRDNPLPIEISSFGSGATLDYQFDIPVSGEYVLQLMVTGVGEPSRFDPNVGVVAVNADGTDGSVLSPAKKFELPGNETEYWSVLFPMTLNAGKQTIRLKDYAPYSPSGLRIATVKVADPAGVADVSVDGESAASNVYYNLQGIRVTQPVAGQIYIVNGKKVVFGTVH